MSRFLGNMDQISFTDCIVIILPNFRAILILCMERYQQLKFIELQRGTHLQGIKSSHQQSSVVGRGGV